MAKLKSDKYTLVQHSGAGYAGKPGFEHAVEERHLTTDAQVAHIQKIGGFIFDSYTAAADQAELENYPDVSTSFLPRARGTFSKYMVDGLRVYIPHAEVA